MVAGSRSRIIPWLLIVLPSLGGRIYDDGYTGLAHVPECNWDVCEFAPPSIMEPTKEGIIVTWEHYAFALVTAILASQGGIHLTQPTHTLQTTYILVTAIVGLFLDAAIIGLIAEVIGNANAKQRAKRDFMDKVWKSRYTRRP